MLWYVSQDNLHYLKLMSREMIVSPNSECLIYLKVPALQYTEAFDGCGTVVFNLKVHAMWKNDWRTFELAGSAASEK